MKTQVAIVGGGVSGLALARILHERGQDFQLFEGRERFGGRVLSARQGGAGFDLGPSWFWPGQPRIATLIKDLGLRVFEQHASGALCFETQAGEVMRDRGFSSMQGSLRVEGGMAAITDALVARLPPQRLHLSHQLQGVTGAGQLHFSGGITGGADQIVLALPPRVAAQLSFEPPLAPGQGPALEQIPTWMAGTAKFVAIYERPFWREDGLSGDAQSQRGPLIEIHDASGHGAQEPGALFGFVGVPFAHRSGQDSAVAQAALAQLARIFGPQALAPMQWHYQDWAAEPMTATPRDQAPLAQHPDYGLPEALRELWDGRLRLAGTEVAPEMGGYLEGALASAEFCAAQLISS